MQAKARKAARARRVEMFFIGNFLAKDCVVTKRMKRTPAADAGNRSRIDTWGDSPPRALNSEISGWITERDPSIQHGFTNAAIGPP
jgi:hypothetical protein